MRSGREHVDGRGWGPAGNTGRGYSRLRSGREHWAVMVVVEVRQGTLGGDTRGWGPTENTVDRGSQLDEDDEEDEEDEEDDEEEEDEEEEDEEEEERRRRGGGEEEQATDIKSNNPHLAGGEQQLDDLGVPPWLFGNSIAFLQHPMTSILIGKSPR